MPASVKSHKTRTSYRSKASYVDETLFGNNNKKQPSQIAKAGASILSINELRKIREQTEKGLQKDAVIIPKNEIERIKNSTKIVSADEAKQMKHIMEEQKEKQMEIHNARKKRMMQMDRERSSKLPPSDFQVEQTQYKTGILQNAQKAIDEEKDDVKTMNQMVLYSKCVTIRDRQLEEQKRLEQEYVDENKRLDLMMEIERLKSIQHQEELEQKRKEAQRHGALIIIEQIKERELDRIKEQELLEKEKHQMVEQINKLKAEEELQVKREKERARKLLEEVENSNNEAQTVKRVKAEENRRLDDEILQYNIAKTKLEEEREMEKRRMQEEKEKEVQRLRELQEKAADRQAEIDALRAKRAFEEGERKHREKERQEMEYKLKVMRDMEAARQTQFREKEKLMIEQAQQERDEYMRVIRSQKEEAEKERQIDDEKKSILKNHSHQLRTQIIQNEEVKKQDRLDYLEEGRRVRQNLENERQRLETIRVEKLNELKDLGISGKYQADLSRKKITF